MEFQSHRITSRGIRGGQQVILRPVNRLGGTDRERQALTYPKICLFENVRDCLPCRDKFEALSLQALATSKSPYPEYSTVSMLYPLTNGTWGTGLNNHNIVAWQQYNPDTD